MSRRTDAARSRHEATTPGRVSPTSPATTAVADGGSETEPQALVVTHWFDSGEGTEPYSATVRFTGRRAGIRGAPGPGDTFVHDEAIDRVVPDSGPVSVSAWIYGINGGEWSVSAELMMPGAGRRATRPRDVRPATWSWRQWAVSTSASPLGRTRWALTAPLARIPAVVPGSLPVLVAIGTFFALAVQAAILGHEQVDASRGLLASLIGLAAGLVAAKAWYLALHPREPILRAGWAVDGFLIVAPIAATTAVLALKLPVGAYLDAGTPGLFLAVALGRVGCFLTGCCAGRVTSSRWGVWSSDRRVGARRIPTQLLESAIGILLGLATLPLALVHAPFHGLVFVGAFLVYAAARQVLLRLRAEQRRSARSLPLTAAAAALVIVGVVGVLVAVPRHPPVMLSAAAPAARAVSR